MKLEIGEKIRESRKKKNITQEETAEIFAVSRQTISNWENEKSYPDILSVIKMSEVYDVSLDYLLKYKKEMEIYYKYLSESTDVVKSNEKIGKLILCFSYLLVWTLSLIGFWYFYEGEIGVTYRTIFLWSILPISTFLTAFFIGKNNYWENKKWMIGLILGLPYIFAEYKTYTQVTNVTFEDLNQPRIEMIFVGILLLLVGMFVGSLYRYDFIYKTFKQNRNTIKSISIVSLGLLILSFFIFRYPLYHLHEMKQFTILLFVESLLVSILSITLKKYEIAISSNLGYILGFIFSLEFNILRMSSNGEYQSFAWFIWTLIFIVFTAVGVFVSYIYNKNKKETQ